MANIDKNGAGDCVVAAHVDVDALTDIVYSDLDEQNDYVDDDILSFSSPPSSHALHVAQYLSFSINLVTCGDVKAFYAASSK
ncbi:hypothetical protein CCR75_008508 [Bremia lactucae]|uniref:Uncharacterized protein n=1 Tax=Bremia lactucae TaxID=4779 RepID=A0A976ICV9_BRELC|nr:hypothetical protein CCR75_008508 [Bremia lactucae]